MAAFDNEIINKIIDCVEKFKTNTGLKNYDIKYLGAKIDDMSEHLNWNNPERVTQEYVDAFFNIYESEFSKTVIPTVKESFENLNYDIDGQKIRSEFDAMMKKIFTLTCPSEMIDQIFGTRYYSYEDVEKFRDEGKIDLELTDERIEEAIDQSLNFYEKKLLNCPAYVRFAKEDEKYIEEHPELKKTHNEDNAATLENIVSDFKKDRENRTASQICDVKTSKEWFGQKLASVSTQYMIVRNQYMKLSFWDKWMTAEGRTMGGALRDTKRILNLMNEDIEKACGEKAVKDVSKAIHASAEMMKDEGGAEKFHQATQGMRIPVTIEVPGEKKTDIVPMNEDKKDVPQAHKEEIPENIK